MQTLDTLIVKTIIADALARGYVISVCDAAYGRWDQVVTLSSDAEAIFGALETTDADTMRFHHGDLDARPVGTVVLVHGNEDGVIVADHSGNNAISTLVDDALSTLIDALIEDAE